MLSSALARGGHVTLTWRRLPLSEFSWLVSSVCLFEPSLFVLSCRFVVVRVVASSANV